MKTIIESSGCTSASFTIDGVEENDLTPEQKSELIAYLIDALKAKAISGHVSISQLVQQFPYEDYYVGHFCETCFDNACTTTWKI